MHQTKSRMTHTKKQVLMRVQKKDENMRKRVWIQTGLALLHYQKIYALDRAYKRFTGNLLITFFSLLFFAQNNQLPELGFF